MKKKYSNHEQEGFIKFWNEQREHMLKLQRTLKETYDHAIQVRNSYYGGPNKLKQDEARSAAAEYRVKSRALEPKIKKFQALIKDLSICHN